MTSPLSAQSNVACDSPSSRRRVVLSVAIIALACVAVFGRSVGFDFVAYDDQIHVYNNPYLTPPTWANVAYIWRVPYEHLYIPLSYSVFALLCAIARRPATAMSDPASAFDPHVFHTVNVALHIVNALLVFVLLRRIVKRDDAAVAGALLFALHPFQVESVAWISELRGLLASALGLGAVVVYTGRAIPGEVRARGISRYFAATLLFALSLLAKPATVVLPALVPLLDILIMRRAMRDYALRLGPWMLLSFAAIAVTHHVQHIAPGLGIPVASRLLVAGDALAFYIGKLTWPLNTCINYGRTPASVLANPITDWIWLVPVAVAISAAVAARRLSAPWVVSAGLISLAALGPVLGLVPFVFQGISTVADRYAYLALIGPALAVAFGVKAGGRPALVAVGAILAALGAISFMAIGAWRNTFTLMTTTLTMRPEFAEAHLDVGDYYVGKHDFATAEREYRLALKYKPGLSEAHYKLAKVLKDEGTLGDAISEFQAAVQLDPSQPSYYMGLGNAVLDASHPGAALSIFDEAQRRNPTFATLSYNRGIALMQLGRNGEALNAFSQEIATNPTFAPSYVNEGIILVALKRFSEAESAMQKAVAMEPTASRYANLAYVQAQLGRIDDAKRNIATALSLDPNDDVSKSIYAQIQAGGRAR